MMSALEWLVVALAAFAVLDTMWIATRGAWRDDR